jgi:polysaccharide deacetylase 2 family uncharacterized protein YibQ
MAMHGIMTLALPFHAFLKASLILLCLLSSMTQAAPSLVIILDDIGNNHALGKRAVELPGSLTLAFLPHTPFAARLAEQASKQPANHQKGIMLHAPMANETGAKLGPGAMTEGMNKETLQATLEDNLNSIPHVRGVNNHMGSLLTQQQHSMTWVMDVIEQRGLYFVDSLTNPASVAAETAEKTGIPSAERDVFLDNERELGSLVKQFQQALNVARKQGHVILIGHPYPETLDFLEAVLPTLEEKENIELLTADDFLARKMWLQGAQPTQVSRLQLQLLP